MTAVKSTERPPTVWFTLWLRRAIDGIRQMHLSEDAHREVAGRIF
jgi:hypothetical protein